MYNNVKEYGNRVEDTEEVGTEKYFVPKTSDMYNTIYNNYIWFKQHNSKHDTYYRYENVRGEGFHIIFPDSTLKYIREIVNEDTYDREGLISEAEKGWSSAKKRKKEVIYKIKDELNRLMYPCQSVHVDHAKSLKENGIEAHDPDNFQIITARKNSVKGDESWEKYPWEIQYSILKGHMNAVINEKHLTDENYDAEKVQEEFENLMDRYEGWYRSHTN
jgi:hypothetical protein